MIIPSASVRLRTRPRTTFKPRVEGLEDRLVPTRLDLLDAQFVEAQSRATADRLDGSPYGDGDTGLVVERSGSEDIRHFPSVKGMAIAGGIGGINAKSLVTIRRGFDLAANSRGEAPTLFDLAGNTLLSGGTGYGTYSATTSFATQGAVAGGPFAPIAFRLVPSRPGEADGQPVRLTLEGKYVVRSEGTAGGGGRVAFRAAYDAGSGPVQFVSGTHDLGGNPADPTGRVTIDTRIGDVVRIGAELNSDYSYTYTKDHVFFPFRDYDFTVTAVAEAVPVIGVLAVSPTALDYGEVTLRQRTEREFQIRNDGPVGSTLDVTIGDPVRPYTITTVGGEADRRHLRLGSGESATVRVALAPDLSILDPATLFSQVFGRQTAALNIAATSEGQAAMAEVALTGLVVPAVPINLRTVPEPAASPDNGILVTRMTFESSSGQPDDFFAFGNGRSSGTTALKVREYVDYEGGLLNPTKLPAPFDAYVDPGYKSYWDDGNAFLINKPLPTAFFLDRHGYLGFDEGSPLIAPFVPAEFTMTQHYEYSLLWVEDGAWQRFGPEFRITRRVYQDGFDAGSRPMWWYSVTKEEPSSGFSVTRRLHLGDGSRAFPSVGPSKNYTPRSVSVATGPTIRVLNPDGSERSAVQPLGPGAAVRTATADFTGDGVADIVAGTGPGRASRVVILDGASGAEVFAFDPFEPAFVGGIFVAAGDLDGDGVPELVVSPDEGGGPRIRVLDGRGFGQVADFFGIDDPNFRGGVRPAVGDINGDGAGDLLVAAGFGGGPRVAGFDGRSIGGAYRKLFADFFAFEVNLRNGVYLAAGDLDGDGKSELIAGAGPGGGPRVLALSGAAILHGRQEVRANFFGGDPANRGGIRVAVKTLDDDDMADLVVGSGADGTRVTAYYSRHLSAGGIPPEAFALDLSGDLLDGVYVG